MSVAETVFEKVRKLPEDGQRKVLAFVEQLQPEHTLPDAESFVDRASRLDSAGHSDAALDLLYDSVDEMLRRSEFARLDSILNNTAVADCSPNTLIGLLTASLPARSRLPSRKEFYAAVERALRQRGEYEDGLLTGLGG